MRKANDFAYRLAFFCVVVERNEFIVSQCRLLKLTRMGGRRIRRAAAGPLPTKLRAFFRHHEKMSD
jgi:hypothetical protein